MAKPKIFISSTYYDLKHIRSSIESFIETLGYDIVLSEKGGIAYNPDLPLDESCYREAKNSDIFVLIIGGRYGSPRSEEKGNKKLFFERYESVTKMEFESALTNEIPLYILIDKSVKAEFETFKNNRENESIKYAHVDSVNIFFFIERILNLKKNNPVKEFDNHSEIEQWLKLQWAGLFQELIRSRKNQEEISELSNQVSELSNLNQTLKSYLEEIVTSTSKDNASELIKREEEKLIERRKIQKIKDNKMAQTLMFSNGNKDVNEFIKYFENVKSLKELANKVAEENEQKDGGENLMKKWRSNDVLEKINELRDIIEKPHFK
jgi:ribosomal protein L17